MVTPLPKASCLSAPFAAALLLLAGCGDGPTAPDPLDAEALANRLEVIARVSPRIDGIMLGAASVHFRDAGRVTPITVIVGGRSETWYAASSEMVFPDLPCLPPAPGLACPGSEPLAMRHLFAVDGVDAKRLLVISTSTDGGGSFGHVVSEGPVSAARGFLLVRGSGVQAHATGGSMTSSLAETVGPCPEPPRRGPEAPPIESCEHVSITWQVDAEFMMQGLDGGSTAAMSIDVPAIDVAGTRLVLAASSFPGS